MTYKLLTQKEKIEISPELLNENRYRIVSDKDKYWVMKHSSNEYSNKRDYLGYLLGKKFCNVAEVRLIDNAQLENLKQYAQNGEYFTTDNTCLVRLAHSYSVHELVCKSLEEAIAAELIFSLFVRRRDAHIDNRVYVKGVPIFFDFHVAFLGEPELTDINVFFSQKEDYGRAGLWRLRKWHSFSGQLHPFQVGSYHFITDKELFLRSIEAKKNRAKEKFTKEFIERSVKEVAFEESTEQEITKFLNKNIETLDGDLEIALEIAFQDFE